jgi:enediyne core biosynthesis thioesterase
VSRFFEYRHVVSLQETNLVGNVYYTRHLEWQGRCREMFLREFAPETLELLRNGWALVTVRCSCEYYAELFAFDEISVRMRLASLSQNRVTMRFEYVRLRDGQEELAARGEQQVASMRRDGDRAVAAPFPPRMREALDRYSE